MPITLTLDNLTPVKERSGEMKNAGADGISALLTDLDTGISLRVKLDQDFVQRFAEAVFGGDANQVGDHEKRPLSQIERDVGTIFVKVVVEKLAEAFAFPKSTKFSCEPEEEDNQIAEKVVFRPKIAAKLGAQFGTHLVCVTCELPAEFIALANSTSTKEALQKVDVNPNWVKTINDVLEPTEIELTAVLTELPLKLTTFSSLKIGQTIPLDIKFSSAVKVRTGDINLYSAHLGQSHGKYCLFIDEMSALNPLNSEDVA